MWSLDKGNQLSNWTKYLLLYFSQQKNNPSNYQFIESGNSSIHVLSCSLFLLKQHIFCFVSSLLSPVLYIKRISDTWGQHRRGDEHYCFVFACAGTWTRNTEINRRPEGCLPCTAKARAFSWVRSGSLVVPGPHFQTALLQRAEKRCVWLGFKARLLTGCRTSRRWGLLVDWRVFFQTWTSSVYVQYSSGHCPANVPQVTPKPDRNHSPSWSQDAPVQGMCTPVTCGCKKSLPTP